MKLKSKLNNLKDSTKNEKVVLDNKVEDAIEFDWSEWIWCFKFQIYK